MSGPGDFRKPNLNKELETAYLLINNLTVSLHNKLKAYNNPKLNEFPFELFTETVFDVAFLGFCRQSFVYIFQ